MGKREPEISNKFMECNILANKIARENRNDQIFIEHFLVAMIELNAGVGYTLIQECNTSLKSLKKELSNTFVCKEKIINIIDEGEEGEGKRINFSNTFKAILEDAEQITYELNHNLTCTGHVLLAVLRSKTDAASLLHKYGLTYEISKNQYIEICHNAGSISNSERHEDMQHEYVGQQSRNSSNKKGKSAIETYCTDVTQMAFDGKLDPVIGREKEIQRLQQILARKTKNNPVLLGESGTGKSAIIEGLAQRIVNNETTEFLKDKRLYLVDLGGVVAGTKYRGQFEERLKNLIKELEEDPKAIAVIDEMHTLAGAGAAEGSIDASNMVKQPLSRGTLRMIGITTSEEYRKFIEKDRALDRRFQPIIVNAPDKDETLEILKGLRAKYEDFHGVTYSDCALMEAVRLSAKYMQDRNMPDKAIDILDECGARAKLRLIGKPKEIIQLEEEIKSLQSKWDLMMIEESFEQCEDIDDKIEVLQADLKEQYKKIAKKAKDKSYTIKSEEIIDVVSSMTSIPLNKLKTEEDKAKYKNMEIEIAKNVVSQKEAIAAVSRAMKRSRVGLKEPNKPMGCFLFLGPTGCGKSQLAKELANYVFGDENAMLVLDMSEYQEKHDSSRLLGANPGYIGHGNAGVFESLRKKPYTVILIDEVEKAHPDVLMTFLQIMEEGRITDSMKNVINFKNTIIIMTSNIGSKKKKGATVGLVQANTIEETYEAEKARYMEAAKKEFKAEFLNRLDGVYVFRSLTKDNCREILDIHIRKFNEKNLKDQNIELALMQNVKDKLIRDGYDEEYGFRPLKRIFQNVVLDPLADYLLDLEESCKKRLIACDLKDDQITFSYRTKEELSKVHVETSV